MGPSLVTRALALHAVRVAGMTDAAAVARRTGLAREVAEELLLDDEARGWVSRVAFADLAGWSLTEAGRLEGERRLAEELERTGARPAVDEAHDTFARLNERFLSTLTRWQIRPQPWDRLAANDHDDPVWDGRVLDELASYRRRLGPLCAEPHRRPRPVRRLRRPVRRGARPGRGRPARLGRRCAGSTRATRCGSSCTRTSSPRWDWTAAPSPDPASDRQVEPPCHAPRSARG